MPVNNHIYEDARQFYRELFEPNVGRGKRIYLWGHSAGGAMAEVLAGMFLGPFGWDVRSICTFGAPKPGFAGVCNEQARQRVRYMYDGDPVPGLPQVGAGTWVALLAGGLLPNTDINRWVHGSGGVLIPPDLAPHAHPGFEARQDIRVGPGTPDSFQRWIDQQPPEVDAHSIRRYQLSLSRAIVAERRADEMSREQGRPVQPDTELIPPPNRLPIEQPGPVVNLVLPFEPDEPRLVLPFNPTTPAQLRNAGAETVLNRVTPAQPATQIPFTFPPVPPTVPISPGGVAVAVMRGGIVTYRNGETRKASKRTRSRMARVTISPPMRWTPSNLPGQAFHIFWNDYLIATADTRSAAKTACKVGNALLRRLGQRLTIHQAAFLGAWGFFIGQAAAGEGYEPPLRVDA